MLRLVRQSEARGAERVAELPGNVRRSRRRRANGEGSIWLRKDGRYGFAAYVPTTAGPYKRVQGYARTRDDARKKLTELVRRADLGLPVASVN